MSDVAQAEIEPTAEPAPNEPPADTASEAPPPPNGADQTLGDGGGGDDLPQGVPATWPEDWRQRFAGSDEDALKTLNRFKDPSNVFKSYKALRARVDGGEFRKARPSLEGLSEEKATEAMAAWRAEAGVPETAEAYYENLPEGVEVRDADKPYLDNYFSKMHARGISIEDAQEGLKAYYEGLVEAEETQHEKDGLHRQEAEDALRAEWGPEYRANLNGMHALLDAHAPEGLREKLFASRMSDGTPLGDDPDFLRLMVGLGRELNPGGTVTPAPGQDAMQTIAEEISDLERQSADTKGKESDYWANANKQARLRELYEMEEKMKARGR